MTQGEEHVLRALGICRAAAEGVAAVDGADDAWRAETGARLTRIAGKLDEVKERFFLKSKLCLPFAARCEEQALALEEGLAGLRVESSEGAVKRLTAALDALDRATRVLDERSDTRGMAIT